MVWIFLFSHQFWDLYLFFNEKGHISTYMWDDSTQKCTLTRTICDNIMIRWFELVDIASNVWFNDEGDSLVWQYNSSGIYSTQSSYVVTIFRGILPLCSCVHSCHLASNSSSKNSFFPVACVV